MKAGKILWILAVVVMLVNISYAEGEEKYISQVTKINNKLKMYESDYPTDTIPTMEMLAKAKLAKERLSDPEKPKLAFTDAQLQNLKSIDAEFRKTLKTRVERQGINKLSSAGLNALVAEAEKEFGVEELIVEPRVYTSAVFYPSKTGTYGLWILAIAIIIALVYRFRGDFKKIFGIFSFFRGKLPSFKTTDITKNVAFWSKKAKEDVPVMINQFGGKEVLMQQNETHFREIKEIFDKESLGAARDEKVIELEKTWKDTIVEPLIKKNKEIEGTLEKLKLFLNYFEKGEFEKRFAKEFEEDSKKLAYFERALMLGSGHHMDEPGTLRKVDNIGAEFEEQIDRLKEVIETERHLIIEAFPEYNKLANLFRELIMRLRLEEVIVNKEHEALRNLTSSSLQGTRIASLVGLLTVAAEQKKKLFVEEKALFSQIQELEKKLGPISTLEIDALEKEAIARRKLDLTSSTIKKNKKKHMIIALAESPLEIKNQNEVTERDIDNLAKLHMVLSPPALAKSSDVLNDIQAFMLFRKQKSGSYLSSWIREEYNEALADDVQSAIDSEGLPDKLSFAAEQKVMDKMPVMIQTIKDPEEIRKLNRIRKRIVQLIDVYYPPLIGPKK